MPTLSIRSTDPRLAVGRCFVGAFVILAALVSEYSIAQSPSTLWTHSGSYPLGEFGWSTAVLRDVDGDGLAEVAVGARAAAGLAGVVSLHSGANGAQLWQRIGSAASAFGTSIACIGDADGDGVDDLAVGAPATGPSGAVHLLSGLTGQILWSVPGTIFPPAASIGSVGAGVYAIGDIDADGAGDVWAAGGDLVGSFGAIFSGRNGGLLRVHNSTNSRRYPARACPVGDRDGDGYDDYAYGCPEDRLIGFPTIRFGSVTIASGLTGVPFLIIEGEHTTGASGNYPAFGYSLASFGDWNGDTVTDLVVGDPLWDYGMGLFWDAGRTRAISGADGAVLATYGTATGNSDHGKDVFATGDVTGDGYGDFAMSNWLINTAYPSLQIVDGRAGQIVQTLSANPLIHLYWGETFTGGRDLDGDRIPDAVTGVSRSPLSGPPGNLNGMVFAVDLGFGGMRPLARTRGVGCAASSGRLPQFRIQGLPKLGNTVATIGRALPPSTLAVLAFGVPLQQSLGNVGAPACTAYVAPALLFAATTNAGGYVRFDFPVPPAPALQGIALSAQWLSFDAAANPLGIVVSDVADLELQP